MTNLTAERAFTDRLLGYFVGEAAPLADEAIIRYFAHNYTGSQFETRADRDPNRITANDIVAVSMLGVNIPAEVAVWLLGDEGAQRTSELLAKVPDDINIWEHPRLVSPGSALWELWDVLLTACWPTPKKGNGMGRTKISKLLAAKRPRLVPVSDSVIDGALASAGLWADFAQALSSSDVREVVEAATASSPPHLSLLRRIDIVIWMREH